MRLFGCLSITLLITFLGGCTSLDTLTKKQVETEGRLEQVLQTTASQRTELAGLSQELRSIEKRVAGVEAGLASIAREIDELRTRIVPKAADDKPRSASATIEVVNNETEKPDIDSVQQQAYMKAFGTFSSNRYNEAISLFAEFIAAYPSSEYAPNAQYWLGECYYSKNDYRKALEAFNEVLLKYPKGNKVPDAMLKSAFSQSGLGDHASARVTLQKLIETYPKSPAAAKARQRLSQP